MNRRLYRLVAGFLLVFVAVSIAPKVPEIARGVAGWSIWPAAWAWVSSRTLPTIDLGALQSLPLLDTAGVWPVIVVGGLTLLLLWSITRRHVASRSAVPARGKQRPATSTAVARSRTQAAARAAKDDSLGAQIRQAAIQGERAPALAKRFGLSQDAIRVATGRSSIAAPRPSGEYSRNRPAALSTLAVARAAAAGQGTALPRG